jgi:transcription elongation factor Elf1
MDSDKIDIILKQIKNLLPSTTETTINTIKELLEKDMVKNYVEWEFYGGKLYIPSNIFGNNNEMFKYIKKQMKDKPFLFTGKRECKVCNKEKNITNFNPIKVANNIYTETLCKECKSIEQNIEQNTNINIYNINNINKKLILKQELDKNKNSDYIKYKFYDDIIEVPNDIVKDSNKLLEYIRKLANEHPEMFKSERKCRLCEQTYNITYFDIEKIGRGICARNLCNICYNVSKFKF